MKADAPQRCQLHDLPEIGDPLPLAQLVWQFCRRIPHMLRRRVNYLRSHVKEFTRKEGPDAAALHGVVVGELVPGDVVRVRSREEILGTLDHWSRLKGCSFMEEMWPYCGTRQTVLKRVSRFIDERDYRFKKCRGVVLLSGVMCEGVKDIKGCDRSCLFFWKEEWLEKPTDLGGKR